MSKKRSGGERDERGIGRIKQGEEERRKSEERIE